MDDVLVEAEGQRIRLAVRVNPRARHIGIRIPSDGGPPRLTLPRPALLAQGRAFAQSRAAWILARLHHHTQAARPFRPGLALPWAGGTLHLGSGPTRAPRRDGDVLAASGDDALYANRIRRWLAADARALLDRESREMAAAFGLKPGAIGVGDPRSRWGSCSSSGGIRYSWRLLLAPDMVRRAVVAHELAHLREPNHGPRFWALATEVLGASHDPARAWLRRHGGDLHVWGREPG